MWDKTTLAIAKSLLSLVCLKHFHRNPFRQFLVATVKICIMFPGSGQGLDDDFTRFGAKTSTGTTRTQRIQILWNNITEDKVGWIKMSLPFSEDIPTQIYFLYECFLVFFSKYGSLNNFKYANILFLKAITNSNTGSLLSSEAIFCPKSLDGNIQTNTTVYLKRVNQRKSHITIVKNRGGKER